MPLRSAIVGVARLGAHTLKNAAMQKEDEQMWAMWESIRKEKSESGSGKKRHCTLAAPRTLGTELHSRVWCLSCLDAWKGCAYVSAMLPLGRRGTVYELHAWEGHDTHKKTTDFNAP
jgi:hypothetical protein